MSNNKLANYISKIPFIAKNFNIIPTVGSNLANPENIPMVENNAHRPKNFLIPLQLQRVTQDIQTWLAAVAEAENAYYPHRFRMQQMFINKILEGHTQSCITKRKDLTLLKDFLIQNEAGKPQDEYTRIFKNKVWFNNLVNYILDAQFFGFSLIQLGDLVEQKGVYDFKELTIIKRWHVSPDRYQLSQIPYSVTGINFLDENIKDDNGISYADWMIYVSTPSDVGSSICGFGLLYNIALYGIILSDNLGNNATYTERYSTPYRHVTTDMTLSDEQQNVLEDALRMMGANGYVITKNGIKIEFKETNTGAGYKSYESLETRCEAKISKLILGHADAMDSTPGKLGGSQGNKFDEDSTPVGQAIAATEKKQDAFVLNVLNDTVLPKLRKIGFRIPENFTFALTRDKEEMEARKKEDAANKVTADIAQVMKNAGLKMDAKYFEERTGIPTEEIEEPEPQPPMFPPNITRPELKNKLNRIYSGIHGHGK